MKLSILSAILFLMYISVVSSHQSYYYSNQNSANYHPPYDFTLDPNQPACNSTLCDPATQSIAINPNYSIPASSGRCNNEPPFMVGSQFDFDPCCTVYDQCLNQCGPSKTYCDSQLYACMWYQCGVTYRVRPADRIQCRAYATCYASYMAFTVTCESYNAVQAQACTCVALPTNPDIGNFTRKSIEERQGPSLSASPNITLPSPSPSFNPNFTAPSSSPSFNPSFTASSSSPSSSPSFNPNFTEPSPSPASFESDSSQSVVNQWGTYVLRPIPEWTDFQPKCPPYFGNYVNVMNDQEFNDINFWFVSGASALKVWWKLF